jgi:hypothetical protein
LPGVSVDQRQRCDKAVSDQLKASSQTTPLDGGWRLVKTRESGGAAEVTSVMHAADTARSDPNLAGLTLHCGRAGIEAVLIVLEPLPHPSHPVVALTAGSKRSEFEASVALNGAALLLPQTASLLAAGEWQNAPELSIEIATKSDPIRGIVPIQGLAAALSALSPNCGAR